MRTVTIMQSMWHERIALNKLKSSERKSSSLETMEKSMLICQVCISTSFKELGQLGDVKWVRCEDCGWTQPENAEGNYLERD